MNAKGTASINKIDPVDIIVRGRQQQRAFCDDLETVADQILDPVDPEFLEILLNNLSADLPLFQSDEEALYSIMQAREPENRLLTKWIDRAIVEHRCQADYALELADSLADLAAGQRVRNAQATGYLLRCVFDSIRHHLAWEEITLFDQSFDLISSEEQAKLSARLAQNRRDQPSRLRLIN